MKPLYSKLWKIGFALIIFLFPVSLPAQDDITLAQTGSYAGFVEGSAVYDHYLYLLQGHALNIIDTQADELQIIASYLMDGRPFHMAVQDHYGYVIYQSPEREGLVVLDLIDPLNPVEIGYLALNSEYVHDVGKLALDGDYAYIQTFTGNEYHPDQITAVNITDPTQPGVVANLSIPGFSNRDLTAANGLLYTTFEDTDFLYQTFFDIYAVDGDQFNLLGRLEPPPNVVFGGPILLNGPVAYLDADYGNTNMISVIDLDPINGPVYYGDFPLMSQYTYTVDADWMVHYDADHIIAGDVDLITMIDTTDPFNPVQGSILDMNSSVMTGLHVLNDKIYTSYDPISNYSKVLIEAAYADTFTVERTYRSVAVARQLYRHANILYAATYNMVWHYDLTDPAGPLVYRGRYGTWIDHFDNVTRMAASTDYLYILNHDYEFKIFALTDDPFELTYQGSFFPQGLASDFHVAEPYLFVIESDSLRVMDLSDPVNPQARAALPLPGIGKDVLMLPDNILAVAYFSLAPETGNGVALADLTDPLNPVARGTAPLSYRPQHMDVGGDYLFVGSATFDNDDYDDPTPNHWALEAFHWADPDSLIPAGFISGEGPNLGGVVVHDDACVISLAQQRSDELQDLEQNKVQAYRWTIQPDGSLTFELQDEIYAPSPFDLLAFPAENRQGALPIHVASRQFYTYDSSCPTEYRQGVRRLELQQPDPGPYTLTVVVDPSEAAQQGCHVLVNPEQDEYDADTIVNLDAVPGENWTFVRWFGSVSGASNPVDLTITRDEHVIALFIKPTLNLQASPIPDQFLCPADTSLTMFNFSLTASEDDDWQVSGMTVTVLGNFLAADIASLEVHRNGAIIGSNTLSSEDGRVNISFSDLIPHGQTHHYTLVFRFEDLTCPDDFVDLPLREIQARIKASDVHAVPVTYPPGERLPAGPYLSGMQTMACVYSHDGEYAYAGIAAAINNDLVTDGTRLNVCPGQYTEEVTVDKGVTIASVMGPLVTSVRPPAANRVNGNIFTVLADDVSIFGLTIAAGNNGVVLSQANNVNIGSDESALARNVIIDNDSCGVQIIGGAGHNIVNNYIGIDPAGAARQPNGQAGLAISGGTEFNVNHNTISGNDGPGLILTDGSQTGHHIWHNFIGTNPTGTDSLANHGSGIHIVNSTGNLIGGLLAEQRNIISGNRQNGIFIGSVISGDNAIRGNLIGLKADGVTGLGNRQSGILIDGASEQFIGGEPEEAANTIAFNDSSGVTVLAGEKNSIRFNAIFDNGKQGIDLNGDGLTENDTTDVDAGPNKQQNYPVISGVEITNNVTVEFHVDSDPAHVNYPLTIDFYKAAPRAQTQEFVATATFTAENYASGGVILDLGQTGGLGVTTADRLTATATDADGNTSEIMPAPCLSITDDLVICANLLTETEDDYYVCQGDVKINNLLAFEGPVQVDLRDVISTPRVSGSGRFYAANIQGQDVTIFPGGVAWTFNADGNELTAQSAAAFFDIPLFIGGFPLKLAGLAVEPDGSRLTVNAIPQLPFPLDELVAYYSGGSVATAIDNVGFSLIYSPQDGRSYAGSIEGLEMNLVLFKMEDVHIEFNTAEELFGGGFQMTIPGDPRRTRGGVGSLGEPVDLPPEFKSLPVEIVDEHGRLLHRTDLNAFIDLARSGGYELLSFGLEIEFVSGAINRLEISVSVDIPLGPTGLFITEISGGVRDLAQPDWKIAASVDIETGIRIGSLGSPVKLDNMGVEIAPMTNFKGSGVLLVFESEVANGYIEYDHTKRVLDAEGNLDLEDIVNGRMYTSIKSGEFRGGANVTLKTPDDLPWYLGWAEGWNLASAGIDIHNGVISASAYVWPVTLCVRLEFGKPGFPYFHFYLDDDFEDMWEIWRGQRDDRQIVEFAVPENAFEILAIVGDDLNEIPYTLIAPDGTEFTAATADYRFFDNSQQAVMRVRSPRAGTWQLSTAYTDPFQTHFLVRNQPPTLLIDQPASPRSRSHEIVLHLTDYDDTLQVELYYDNDNKNFDGVYITEFQTINNGDVNFTWVPDNLPDGEYFIYARVADGQSLPARQYAPGSILIDNYPDLDPPQNLAVTRVDTTIVVSWAASNRDPVGAIVSYRDPHTKRWEDVAVSGQNELRLDGLAPGFSYPFTVRFFDANLNQSAASSPVVFDYFGSSGQNPPHFTAGHDTTWVGLCDVEMTLDLNVRDFDDDQLTFGFTNTDLALTITADPPRLVYTPATDDQGYHNPVIIVSDGTASDSLSINLFIFGEDQARVDVGFSSPTLFAGDNMFVTITNFYSELAEETIWLENRTTGEQAVLNARRVDILNFITHFVVSTDDSGDLAASDGDIIQATYDGGDGVYLSQAVFRDTPQAGDLEAPAAVVISEIGGLLNYEINLRWIAPGDDGMTGHAMAYDIRHGFAPIENEADFAAATVLETPHYPGPGGEPDSLSISLFDIAGAADHQTIYFNIRAIDDAGHIGGLSNTVAAEYDLPMGDVNQDGLVNTIDISLVAGHVLGLNRLDGVAFELADLTDDDRLDIVDILSIISRPEFVAD